VTAEPLADTATMHGFLNVLFAAALAYRGASRSTIASALAETDWKGFSFTLDQVAWRGQSVDRDELARFRAASSGPSVRSPSTTRFEN
jgi:hypothetical protein